MSHTIYQTKGVVLGRRNFGEADSFFYVLTKEFGLIQAVAQGVRHLKSKLRYNLDLLSLSNFSLVQGRNKWRIIDAENTGLEEGLSKFQKSNFTLARVSGFLIRMLRGEEKNEFIWNEFFCLADGLKQKNIDRGEVIDIEILTMAKILNNLGYIEQKVESIPHQQLITEVNRAIKESML